ncbi:hypothetical protein, partial [Rhodococcus qingshengii]
PSFYTAAPPTITSSQTRSEQRRYANLGADTPDVSKPRMGGARRREADADLNAAAGLVADELSRHPEQFHRSINDRFRAALDCGAHAIDNGTAKSTLDRWIAATTAANGINP